MTTQEARALLDVPPGATQREVKEAHRRFVLAVHPDRISRDANPRAWEAANTLLRRLNEASAVLQAHSEADLNASSGPEHNSDLDHLWGEAACIVVLSGLGSISLLQRRLGIGYVRAAHIMNQLEDARIVGPFEGVVNRVVLLSPDDLEPTLRSRGYPIASVEQREASPLYRPPTPLSAIAPLDHDYDSELRWALAAVVAGFFGLAWLFSACPA